MTAAAPAVPPISRAWELTVAILALLVVPALLVEDSATPAVRFAAQTVNWVVWLAFCADLVVQVSRLGRSAVRSRAVWFDLVLVVLSPPFLVPDYLQATRSIRAIRLVRVLRLARAASVALIGLRSLSQALQHRKFHYVALLACAVVALGALGIYAVERDVNRSVGSLGDALWWAIVTVTTVGYGDVSPLTTEGRIIAAILMLIGIGVIGVFTATVASYFVEQKHDANLDTARLEQRLDQVEAKIDRILVHLQREEPKRLP